MHPETTTTTTTGLSSKNWTNHKTPAKAVQRVPGLISLSSSSKKRNLTKYLRANGNRSHTTATTAESISVQFDWGYVRHESLAKFAVNVFQYLLYDNDVIPIPFQYFERIYGSPPKRTIDAKWLAQRQQISGMFERLNATLAFVAEMLTKSTIKPATIAIAFGDSIRFAKQIFALDISSLRMSGERLRWPAPPLTLAHLINTFYKRLLNEVTNESSGGSGGGGNASRQSSGKTTTVTFIAHIHSQQIDKFESFATHESESELFRGENSAAPSAAAAAAAEAIRFEYLYRLGCTITKMTSFALRHVDDDEPPLFERQKFEIYTDEEDDDDKQDVKGDNRDDDDVEEEIEEEIDEANLRQRLDQSTSSLNDSNSNTDEEAKDCVTDLREISSSSRRAPTNDYVWVQIGAPIRCVSKLRL